MARKSRKETAVVAVQEADAACRAAIYVRLSVEDTHTHSVSIETQQMIIARYVDSEIAECLLKCEHIARWFATAGKVENIYIELGVRP